MCVPERMPRYPWLFNLITCRCERAVVRVLRIERCALWRTKHQIVRHFAVCSGAIGFELTAQG